MVAHGSMPKTEKIPLPPSMRAKTEAALNLKHIVPLKIVILGWKMGM